jgi:hypothetical protein
VSVLLAPFAAAAMLLVAAGAPKARRPDPAVRALRSVGWRVPPAAVRVLGAAEAALGLVALTMGGRPVSVLVAVSYAAFTGFVVVALRRGGALASCGCFGRPDTPPTVVHAALTGGLALLAAAAAAAPVAPLRAADPVLLGFAALLTWLCYLALAVLPTASARAVLSTRKV